MAESPHRKPPRLQEFTPATLPAPHAFQDLQIILIQPDGSRAILFSDGRSWTQPSGATSFITLSDAVTAPIATMNTSVADALASKATNTALLAHTQNMLNPHGVTKAQVGLGNVDNTSDLDKPISTATQAALNAIVAGGGAADMTLAATQTVTGPKTFVANAFRLAGSTSGVTILNASPLASGTLTAPAATDTLVARNTTDTLANKTLTDPVISRILNGTGTLTLPINVTDTLTGRATVDTLSNKTVLNAILTGIPVAPNAAAGTASTQVANTLYVDTGLALKANSNNPVFTGTATGLTKASVGLGNVDNTSDANKPISTATQAALDLKANIANPTFTGTVSGITKGMVGLGNVDNTSDANKPISTATATALAAKQNLLIAGANITIVGDTISSTGSGGGASAVLPIAYSTVIPLDTAGAGKLMPATTLIANSTFTVGASPIVDGTTQLLLVSDGSHAPDLSAFTMLNGYSYPTGTPGARSLYVFSYVYGEAVVTGAGLATVDTTPPTIVLATVANATPTRVDLAYSEPVKSAISAAAAWGVTGHTVSAHTYVDSTHTYLTVTPGFAVGEAARTLSYVVPGTNKMQDIAGNLMAAIASQSIASGVADLTPPTLVGADVQNANPSHVVLTWSENMDATLAPISAFAVTGHTVTVHTATIQPYTYLTVTPPFTAGETRTVTYTKPGAPPLMRDIALNEAPSSSAISISNYVAGGLLTMTAIAYDGHDLTAAGHADWLVLRSTPLNSVFKTTGSGLTRPVFFALTNQSGSNTAVTYDDFSWTGTDGSTHNTSPIAAGSADEFLRYDATNNAALMKVGLTADVGTTERVVKVHFGTYHEDAASKAGRVTVRCTLSDGAAAPQSGTYQAPNDTLGKSGFEIHVKAASAGQTLLIEFEQQPGDLEIFLGAITLD